MGDSSQRAVMAAGLCPLWNELPITALGEPTHGQGDYAKFYALRQQCLYIIFT